MGREITSFEQTCRQERIFCHEEPFINYRAVYKDEFQQAQNRTDVVEEIIFSVELMCELLKLLADAS